MSDNLTLTRMPKSKVSGLTYNEIIEDIFNLIKDNPSLQENITDYTSADAVRMLTEMFAWITDQLSQRIDLIGNELFLETVENKQNLLKILKLVGYTLDFPECSSAEFKIEVSGFGNATEDIYYLSPAISIEDGLPLLDSSFARVSHSISGKTFELIQFDDSVKKFDYFHPISIKIKENNYGIVMFEGRTVKETIKVDVIGNFTKTLISPVIKNSIRIFYSNLKNGEPVELKEVDNFFGKEAYNSKVPVYMVSNTGNGIGKIIFPYKGDVKDDILLNIGDELTVFYRTGGGAGGNIPAGAIISTRTLLLNDRNILGRITITNSSSGTGGKSEESMEEIKRNSPQQIRNRTSAVSAEDYEYLLKRGNPLIKDIKVYGENNIPESANLITTYGYSRNPLDIWLFIIKENSLYNSELENLTDYINDIQFQKLDLNERLNEIYQINLADMNIPINTTNLSVEKVLTDNSANELSIFNSYMLPTPTKILNKISNYAGEDFKITITNIPFDEHSGNRDPETDNDSYVFENLYFLDSNTKIPRNTLQFDSNGKIIPLFSDVIPNIENVFPPDGITLSEEQKMIFSIGDSTELNNLFLGAGTYATNSLVQDLNNQINSLINGRNMAIILKEDIQNADDLSGLTGTILIDIEVDSVIYNFSFSANNNSWNGINSLITTMTAENNETLNDIGLFCGLVNKTYDDESCKNLIIYSEGETGFSISSVSFFGDSNFVGSNRILKKEVDTLSIEELDVYFSYSDNKIRFESVEGEKITLKIEGGLTQTLFGISQSEFLDGDFILSNKRVVSLNADGNLLIGVSSPRESLPEQLYISGFWGSETSIRLGKYYEDIDTNDSINIPIGVKRLLKKPPIKNLYNTVLNMRIDEESQIDTFNSDYKIKITRKKIDNSTFFQIGDTDIPPTIEMKFSTLLGTNESMYLKVDGKNYTSGSIVYENGDNIGANIEETIDEVFYSISDYSSYENGFVKFDMSKFSGRPRSLLIKALNNVFGDKISIVSSGSNVYLQSSTSLYYSCLDFTGTSKETMGSVFGFFKEQTKFYSSGMYVPLKKSGFLKFTMAKNEFVSNVNITFKIDEIEYVVNTGNDYQNMLYNLRNKEGLKDLIFVRDSEIFLKSIEYGKKFSMRLIGDTEQILNKIKSMFVDTLNLENQLVNTQYTVFVEKIIDGDYFVERTEDGYYFRVINTNNFPTGDLYFHMIEDYRIDHVVEDVSNKMTDEFVWNNSIENKKMLCVSHVFKQPKFLAFDLEVNVKITKNSSTNKKEEFKSSIYNLISSKYNIYTSKIGEVLYKNNIKNIILDEVPGVVSADVKYLGLDISDTSTDVDELMPKFNEKLIIASKKEEKTFINGVIQTNPIHGLFVKVEYEA